MLIRLLLDNFKSYKEENVLLLTSSSKITKLEDHKRQVSSLNVVKFAGIYGYNAAGKTNILKAVSFIKQLVGYNQIIDLDFSFIENEQKPTKLEIIFSSDKLIYQYGFVIRKKLSPFLTYEIVDEYLNLVGNEVERSKEIYSLKNGINMRLITGHKNATNLDVYLNDYHKLIDNGRPVLFLNYINAVERTINDEYMKSKLSSAFNFIKNNLIIIGANVINMGFVDDDCINQIDKYVKQFDSGIEKVELVSEDIESIQKVIPGNVLNDISNVLKNSSRNSLCLGMNNMEFYFFSKGNDMNDQLKCQVLSIKHKYINTLFHFSQESEGTKKFLVLMSYFSNNNADKVYIVDELERSMHPEASLYLCNFFEKETKDQDTQLIFSTHNNVFMSKALRKDEIFFADKDIYGSSVIYPLTDFKTRTGTEIEKKFLNGSFAKNSIPPYGKRLFK